VDPYAGRADHGAVACWDVSGDDDDEVTRACTDESSRVPLLDKADTGADITE
jgi:hypothetical protein